MTKDPEKLWTALSLVKQTLAEHRDDPLVREILNRLAVRIQADLDGIQFPLELLGGEPASLP
jgi:hypothetical protein